ncbi:concanavalin A-like lectin/glucanase domain-containing protein [Xylariaceae sp. FL0255]|nr:concanavalin A-like lectin/glucanase domain-containing protein [Xylariaceae sp. FL0255]
MAPLLKATALSVLLAFAEARRPHRTRISPSPSSTSAAPPAASTGSGASCDCWTATSSSSAVFQNRSFFDFRDIANPYVPANITDKSSDADSGVTNSYFSSSDWTDTWSIQSWGNSGGDSAYYKQNSQNNVYISPNDGSSGSTGSSYLTLRTTRNSAYQSIAEIDSVATNYNYLTMRMLARTTGSAGACTALFTYDGNTDPVQEADIEILTREPTDTINYTNQPGGTDGATVDATLPGGAEWSDWLVLRYDWTPGSSEWYVNGELAATIDIQTPTAGLSVILNAWGDGGSWTGVMPVGGQALLDVQWLDIAYNTTDDKNVHTCSSTCSIDSLAGSAPPS